jgi:hypothetical protein
LQHRQYSGRKRPQVFLCIVVRNSAERKFGYHVVGAGHALQFGDLLDAVVGRADDLNLDIELGRSDALLLVL